MSEFSDVTIRANADKIVASWWNDLRTAGVTTRQSAATFSSEAAFVTAKGSAAADGDWFYDTTADVVKAFIDGLWTDISTSTASAVLTNNMINSNFELWQRGTSFAAIADGDYSSDRWEYNKSGAMIHTVSEETTSLPNENSKSAIKVDCTTIDASIAAGDFNHISYKMEGYDLLPLSGKKLTLSFWVKGTKTGIHCVAFQNSGADRTYVAEYTISVTDTWEFKTITLAAVIPTAGTWNYTNGVGLRISFALVAGTTFQTTADAWNTGDFLATSNQVNQCDNTANNFYIAQVMLNEGTLALTYRRAGNSFGGELGLCQRYFSKSYNEDVNPATSTAAGKIQWWAVMDTVNFSAAITWAVYLKISMRSNPTIVGYTQAGTQGSWRDDINSSDRTVSFSNVGRGSFSATLTASAVSTSQRFSGHYTADSEL